MDTRDRVVAHATLDCETAGLGARPVLLSIAFVPVTVDGTVLENDWLLIYPDVTSQILKGRSISPDTINWWNGEKIDAKAKTVWEMPRISVEQTLDTIDRWFAQRTRKGLPIMVWGNGSEHDNVWVETLYHDYGRMPPWAYWQNQSLRTLRTLFKQQLRSVPPVGTMHVAEDDALYEANCLRHLLVNALIPNTQSEEFELAAIKFPVEDLSRFAKPNAAEEDDPDPYAPVHHHSLKADDEGEDDDDDDEVPVPSTTVARRQCIECGDRLSVTEAGPKCDECEEEDDD